MPTTRLSKRPAGFLVQSEGAFHAGSKKIRIRAPVAPAQQRPVRKPLSSLQPSTVNKQKTTTTPLVSSPGKTQNDAVVVSSQKNVRSRSRSKERELVVPAQPTVTPTPETRKASSPQDGDRYRVWYDVADDAFGVAREGARGFFFGKLLSASRARKASDGATIYKLEIQFDNGETNIVDYPASDGSVEKVIESCDGPNQLMGENGEFACDLNPSRVDIGDLVFCNYRDQELRYRGRVASLSQCQRFCDILYDDNELEKEVPLLEGKIWLVEDGLQHQQWLDGLKVKLPLGTSRTTVCTIKVLPENEGFVELLHPNGRIEKQNYHEVVQALFEEAKDNCKANYIWPSFTKKVAGSVATETQNIAPLLGARRNINKKEGKKGESGDHADGRRLCLPDDFVLDPWESDASDEDEGWEDKLPWKDMSNSIRNTLWKALNSSDGHFGADLLFKMTDFHNKVPNDDFCKDLTQLLWKGPLHRKNQFPDLIRQELAKNYFDLLKAKGMVPRLSESLPPSFAEDFFLQVLNPATIYCVDGDETRLTPSALQRVGQSLSVKNSGASMFCCLLKWQLRGYQQFGKKTKVVESARMTLKRDLDEFAKELRTRHLTRSILDSLGGTQALKLAVRAAFSVLIHFGHYLSSDFVFPPAPKMEALVAPPHSTTEDRAFVAKEVRRLVKSMGRLVAYMAWLYSIEQGQPMYEARFVIRDAVDGLLTSSTFDPSPFLIEPKGRKEGELNRHWRDMQLQFALSLDKSVSGLLGQYTAELFQLTPKYF